MVGGNTNPGKNISKNDRMKTGMVKISAKISLRFNWEYGSSIVFFLLIRLHRRWAQYHNRSQSLPHALVQNPLYREQN